MGDHMVSLEVHLTKIGKSGLFIVDNGVLFCKDNNGELKVPIRLDGLLYAYLCNRSGFFFRNEEENTALLSYLDEACTNLFRHYFPEPQGEPYIVFALSETFNVVEVNGDQGEVTSVTFTVNNKGIDLTVKEKYAVSSLFVQNMDHPDLYRMFYHDTQGAQKVTSAPLSRFYI